MTMLWMRASIFPWHRKGWLTMGDLSGRTAVVTGSASGFGLCLAEVFLRRGMKVVVADIEQDALDRALESLQAMSSSPEAVMAVVTDVTSAESVNHLADQAFGSYGAVHILRNNAGVRFKEAQRRLRTLPD